MLVQLITCTFMGSQGMKPRCPRWRPRPSDGTRENWELCPWAGATAPLLARKDPEFVGPPLATEHIFGPTAAGDNLYGRR